MNRWRTRLLAPALMFLTVSLAAQGEDARAPEAEAAAQRTPQNGARGLQTPGGRWTMEELLPAVADLKGRDWISGGRVFDQAGCGICHTMSTYWEGNGLSPDLTGVASKMSREEILRSVIEPSATINGQYYHTEFTLEDGTIVSGTVVGAEDDELIVAPVMMVPEETVRIARAGIRSERPSPASPMPAGLVDVFSRDQVLDLIAFLAAGADPEAGVYAK